jgi:hypothetical protein
MIFLTTLADLSADCAVLCLARHKGTMVKYLRRSGAYTHGCSAGFCAMWVYIRPSSSSALRATAWVDAGDYLCAHSSQAPRAYLVLCVPPSLISRIALPRSGVKAPSVCVWGTGLLAVLIIVRIECAPCAVAPAQILVTFTANSIGSPSTVLLTQHTNELRDVPRCGALSLL